MSKLKKRRTAGGLPQLSLLAPPPVPVSQEGRCVHLGLALRATLVEAMRPSRLSRWQIAGKISELLARDVSKAMLDAYCAESHETHRLPAEMLAPFCLVCESDRPLHIIADAMGCVAVPVLRAADPAQLADGVHSAFLHVVREMGEAAQALDIALRDRTLTRLEAARCRREFSELIRAAVTVSHALEVSA